MTEVKLKRVLGVSMIIGHLLVIFWILGLFAMHGFTFNQFTTLLAIVAPMFAAHTTPMVNFIITDRHRSTFDSEQVTITLSMISFILPAACLLMIVATVTLQAYSIVFEDFEQSKEMLGIIEAVFAVSLGGLVKSLFE